MPFDSAPQTTHGSTSRPGHRWFALADVPPRLRLRPLSTAIWRALMMTVAELRAAAGAKGSTAFDEMGRALVLSAIGGDMRAAKLIMDLIDGPVRSKAGRTSDASPRDAGDDAERERTIAGLVMAYEQALAATARG